MTAAPLAVILRPLGLGDFLTGIPAYRAVSRAFPNHRVVLAAAPEFAELLDLVGGIAGVHPTLPLVPLDRALHGADVAVDLHGRGPASHRILLAAEPRRLIAFEHPQIPQSAGGAEWRADEHEVTRWCRMLTHAGVPADPADLDLHALPGGVPTRRSELTILHPSAASEARRWPIDRWATVARSLRAARQTVVITGSRADSARAFEIAERAGVPPANVFAGRTTLRELAALVATAARVVCGDTGVAHLATALRTPSVLLFGPMSPAHWGPPQRSYHRVLWSGRAGDPHGSVVDPGLLEISVEAVLAQLEGLGPRIDVAV